jgi:hypothetical protein
MTTVSVALKGVTNALNLGDGTLIAGIKHHDGGALQKTIGGYVITNGVPAATWNRWFENNKDSYLVQSGQIFADPNPEVVLQRCRSHMRPRTISSMRI